MKASILTIFGLFIAPSAALSITKFVLIDAEKDAPIHDLTEGLEIDLADLPTTKLNVQAVVTDAACVYFNLDQDTMERTENKAPFALRGDKNEDYHAMKFLLGSHSLSATPYTEKNKGGTQGDTLTVNFTIKATTSVTNFYLVDADANTQLFEITEGRVIDLAELPTEKLNIQAITNIDQIGSVQLSLDDQAPKTDNFSPWSLSGESKGNFKAMSLFLPGDHTIQATPYSLRSADGDSGETLAVNFKVINTISATPETFAVTKFVLYDAGEDMPIGELTNGQEIDLANLPSTKVNIVANTDPGIVGSVYFDLDGAIERTENAAPYSLKGDDNKGDFRGMTLSLGSHKLEATPFATKNKGGATGQSLEMEFTVKATTAITQFFLIDADEDEQLFEITQDLEIDLADLPTNNLNIQAITNIDVVGSVVLSLDDTISKVDNSAPWSLAGDKKGDYHGMPLLLGKHTVEATPYSLRSAEGDLGQSLAIDFTVKRTGPCLLGDVSIDANGCSFESLLSAIEKALDEVNCNRDPLLELQIFTGNDSEADLEAQVSSMCSAGWDNVTSTFTSFDDIPNEETSDEFIKAFYDGGTDWNDLRKTTDITGDTKYVLAEYPGERIREVYEGEAKNGGIGYPEEVVNFQQCELRAVMCCWVRDRQAGDKNGNCRERNCVDRDPGDNTDICYAHMDREPTAPQVDGGFAIYEGDSEGDAHCHGFAWAQEENDLISRYKGNNLFFVSMYDHFTQRGYVNPVPGSPMCGCVEKMAVVSRSDCTQMNIQQTATFSYTKADGLSVEIDETVAVEFQACQGADNTNNDLAAYYQQLVNEGRATAVEKAELDLYIVGDDGCDDAIDSFMTTQGWSTAR